MYEQIIAPNLSVVGKDGYCLEYVSEVFGVPEKYDTATDAWNAAIQHPSEQPPSNVSVPVWFSWTGVEDGVTKDWGHVVVWSNGKFYSTAPGGDRTYSSTQEVVNTIGGNASYRGWSEDINSVKVVEGVGMEPANQGDLSNIFEAVYALPLEQADIDYWTPLMATMTFKDLFYAVKGSGRYTTEHFINSGDVTNLQAKGINASAAEGQMWKAGMYDTSTTGIVPDATVLAPGNYEVK